MISTLQTLSTHHLLDEKDPTPGRRVVDNATQQRT